MAVTVTVDVRRMTAAIHRHNPGPWQAGTARARAERAESAGPGLRPARGPAAGRASLRLAAQ